MALDLDAVAENVAARLGRQSGAGSDLRDVVEAAAELAVSYLNGATATYTTATLPDTALMRRGVQILATRIAADTNPNAADQGIPTPADLLAHVHHYFDAERDDDAWGAA